MRQHGSYVTYVQGLGDGEPPCRCEACRAANSEYERERRRRLTPPYVGAARARAHLAELAAAGVGLKSVAKAAGVSHGSLSKLVYGDSTRGTPPSKRIRPATEAKILAVTILEASNGARIPAGPTKTAIDKLLAAGWSKTAIAHALGAKSPGLQVGKRDTVRAGVAHAIAALANQPVPPRNKHNHHATPAPALVLTASEHAAHLDRIDRALEYDLPTLDEAPGDWINRGSCRRHNVPTWLFFPGRGDLETTKRAKAVCATCPVAAECLDYALATNQRHGIWGGLSDKERSAVKRERGAA